MTINLKADGVSGTVVIWTGDDDLPFDGSPTQYLSRKKFDSRLAYPKIISEQTVNVTFPSRTVSVVTQSYTLFAHGRSGYPLVFASALIGSVRVAFTGSVPVQLGTYTVGSGPMHWARWVSVGADATNVYAYEYTVMQWNAGTGANYGVIPSATIPITVWVTDEILE